LGWPLEPGKLVTAFFFSFFNLFFKIWVFSTWQNISATESTCGEHGEVFPKFVWQMPFSERPHSPWWGSAFLLLAKICLKVKLKNRK